MFHLHSEPQHEVSQCHATRALHRALASQDTAGDPHMGGSPENWVVKTNCFTCILSLSCPWGKSNSRGVSFRRPPDASTAPPRAPLASDSARPSRRLPPPPPTADRRRHRRRRRRRRGRGSTGRAEEGRGRGRRGEAIRRRGENEDQKSARRRRPKNRQGCPRDLVTPSSGKKRARMRSTKREHRQGCGEISKGTLASPILATPPCNGLQPPTARMSVPPRVPLDGRDKK